MASLPEILYEDNHLLAINKRAGDLVQGDQTRHSPTGSAQAVHQKEIQQTGNVFLGVIHRSMPHSGVVLFAYFQGVGAHERRIQKQENSEILLSSCKGQITKTEIFTIT